MSTQKNLITLCIATVFTLGLAACGGGGGGGSSPVAMMDDDPPMEPMPAGGITLDAKAVAEAIGPADADPATTVPTALMIVNGVPGAMSPLEASDAVDAASIDGWTSSVTQRMTEAMGGIVASIDTVIIYNDQAARSRPMFSDRLEYDYNVDTDGDTVLDDALRITMGDTGNVGLISGVEEFPSAALQTAVPFDANTNYAGMLDGAPGTFTCADAGCTLTTDADGKLSGASDNWYFIASEGATVDVNDYLRFGFWLNESTDSDGDPSYDIDAFYGGAMATTPRTDYQSADLRGTASYSGAATGAYMRKTFNEDGTVNPVAGGQFTATAALMANFADINNADDQSTIPLSLRQSISGNISNFMDGGEAIPGNWELELMRAPFDALVDVQNVNEDFNGATSGGEGTVPGKWAGMFFGPVALDSNGVTDMNAAEYPTGVAGEFTGHFNTGHVIGAFGATVDDD